MIFTLVIHDAHWFLLYISLKVTATSHISTTKSSTFLEARKLDGRRTWTIVRLISLKFLFPSSSSIYQDEIKAYANNHYFL